MKQLAQVFPEAIANTQASSRAGVGTAYTDVQATSLALGHHAQGLCLPRIHWILQRGRGFKCCTDSWLLQAAPTPSLSSPFCTQHCLQVNPLGLTIPSDTVHQNNGEHRVYPASEACPPASTTTWAQTAAETGTSAAASLRFSYIASTDVCQQPTRTLGLPSSLHSNARD